MLFSWYYLSNYEVVNGCGCVFKKHLTWATCLKKQRCSVGHQEGRQYRIFPGLEIVPVPTFSDLLDQRVEKD